MAGATKPSTLAVPVYRTPRGRVGARRTYGLLSRAGCGGTSPGSRLRCLPKEAQLVASRAARVVSIPMVARPVLRSDSRLSRTGPSARHRRHSTRGTTDPAPPSALSISHYWERGAAGSDRPRRRSTSSLRRASRTAAAPRPPAVSGPRRLRGASAAPEPGRLPSPSHRWEPKRSTLP